MKIKLVDGTELNCLYVNGSTRYFQGYNRDTFEMHFLPTEYTFDQLNEVFSNQDNIKQMIFIDDNENQYAHDNYVVRVGFALNPVVITPETGTTPEVTEDHLIATMAQKTYQEVQLEELTAKVNAILNA